MILKLIKNLKLKIRPLLSVDYRYPILLKIKKARHHLRFRPIYLVFTCIILANLILVLIIIRHTSQQTNSSLLFTRQLIGPWQYKGEIKGVLTASLGKTKDQARIMVEREGSSIEFDLPLANSFLKEQTDQQAKQQTVVYKTKEEFMEIRYRMIDKGIKEEIVLNKNPNSNVLQSRIKLNNLVVKVNSDEIPIFYNEKGDYQFHFDRPFIKDAKGNISYGVKYKIVEIKEDIASPVPTPTPTIVVDNGIKQLLGKIKPVTSNEQLANNYILIVEIDQDWLNDPQRAYPITIDPSVVHDTTAEFATGSFNRIKNTGSPNLETYYQELPADIYTVGLWHMNNNWNDSSGNGNNGTAIGATFTTSAILGSHAGSFDGVDDRVYLSSGTNANVTGDITIEAWVYPTLTSTSTIIHKDYQYSLRIENTGNIYWADSSNWSYANFGATNIGLVANKWQHLAVVKTGGIVKIYLDGIEKASKAFGSAISSTDNVMHIGCYSGASANSCSSSYFPGQIDEVRISNIARTPEEIKTDAQRRPYGVYTSDVIDLSYNITAWNSLSWTEVGVGTGDGETLANSTGLIAQWNFNETSGTTAANNAGSCGSTCNGTLTNFANTSGQDVAAGSGWTANNRRWGTGALMFDGTNNYTNVPDTPSLKPSTAISVEAWVKPNSLSQNNIGIVTKRYDETNDPWNSYILGIYNSQYFFNISNGTAGSQTQVMSASSLTGNWTYVVGTYDGSNIKIYVNGKLEGTAPKTGTIGYSTLSLRIGCAQAGNQCFNGVLDSVRIYNRALTPQEILSNYNAGNIELQTRVGADASPDDGSWEEWRPVSSENIITSMDADSGNWRIDPPPSFPKSCKEILDNGLSTGDGIYTIYVAGDTLSVYCDMTTDGGGWTLVLNNSPYLTPPKPTWSNVVNNNNITGSFGTNLTAFDQFLGVKYWNLLGNQMRLIQGSSPSTISHKAIYNFYLNPANNYSLSMSSEKVLVSTTGTASSGMFTYHAANGFQLTTYDADHDTNGSNCATFYGNTAWWYGDCWSGSFWGGGDGGGYQNAPYWSGSSTEYFAWGSIWIRDSNVTITKSNESNIKIEGTGSMKLNIGVAQPDNNTVGLWHLDETSVGTGSTAYDSSGNNLSAIATGTTLVNGFAGKARKFNGSGDYLSIADNTALKPSTITIEAWVRPDSFASYASLVCKMRDSGGPYGSSYKLGFDLSNHFSFALFDGSRWHTATGNTSITTGQWYHVMGTYDGSDVKIYVNGVLDGKAHWGGQINYLGTRPVIIGAAEELANFGVTSFFNGIIDEVKISNIAQPSDVAMETYLAGSSHRLTRSFSTLDLSTKNKIPFYVASDRQGTFMEATIGESAFANYEPDANTVGLWHLEENTPSFTDGFLTDSNGYPTTQLFGGISGGWSSTGCGDVSSNQTGFLDQYPSPGDSFGGKTWEIASSSNGSFNLDSVICGGDCNNVYSYSLIYLYSPTAQTIRFKWGSDDASQVWVNGSLKYTVSSCQGLTIDQFSVDTPINAGWNRILWRAVEGGGGYWLAWRITDTYNNPLRMIYRVSNPSNSSTVKDASSFGNNGTSYGTTFVQGKIGKGRSFNGSSDYINVNSSSSITPTNAITVEAWVKPTNFTCAGTDTNCSILSKYGGNYIGYKLETNSSGTPFFNICTPSTCPMASSTIPLIAGQWNYVAATWSPSTIKIYVNGVLSGTGSASTLSQDSTTLSIGKASWYNGDYFNGIIDEVRISNVARTPDEIRQAYEVGRRTHPITIDFKAKLDSGNLISNSSDYSFTVDGTAYGAQTKGSNLYKGDKIVVKENIGGTEYLAQGTVTSIDKDTGAATVASWDSGSTFPSGGFTANATVFKWQREYFDITGSLSTHRDAINRITLRMTNGSQGANIWLDDIRSAGSYLTNPAGSTITSSTGYRYFQYRTIFSTNDTAVSPSLTSVTLIYTTNVPPNTPTLDSPTNGATNQSLTPALKTTATDNDNDTLKYKIQLCTDSGMTQNCQTFDQTVSTTGWSASSYASGAQATYTIQSALNPNQTYYWRSYAIDPTGINTWSSTQATPYSFTTTSAPTAPSSPYCEGQTTPVSNVIDSSPEFSAIHNDPNNDPAIYYEIEVGTDDNWTTAEMWDSGQVGMTPTASGARSPDITYGGIQLSNNTTYYWRIRFWDDKGVVSAWSTNQQFTTGLLGTGPLKFEGVKMEGIKIN